MALATRCRSCTRMHGPRQLTSHRSSVLAGRFVLQSAKNGSNAPSTIGRKDLADAVSKATGLTKVASEEAINVLLDAIVTSVAAGHKVSLPGFGVFEPKARAARNGRNPITGEPLVIPAKTAPKFSPATKFKEAVEPALKASKEAAQQKAQAKPAKAAAGSK